MPPIFDMHRLREHLRERVDILSRDFRSWLRPSLRMEGQGTRPNDFPLLLHPFQVADVDGFVQWRNMFYCLSCRKFSMAYDQYVPVMLRRIIEWVFLVVAVFSFLLLFYLHQQVRYSEYHCLDRFHKGWQNKGIFRVDLQTPNALYNLSDSYDKEEFYINLREGKIDFQYLRLYASTRSKEKHNNTVCDASVYALQYYDEYGNMTDIIYENRNKRICLTDSEIDKEENPVEDATEAEVEMKRLLQMIETKAWSSDFAIIEYSSEMGLLALSRESRKLFKIPVTLVTVSPQDECFGIPLNSFLLGKFFGYNEIIVRMVGDFISRHGQHGYVRNALLGEKYRFASPDPLIYLLLHSFLTMGIITVGYVFLGRYIYHYVFMMIASFFTSVEDNVNVSIPILPIVIGFLALYGLEMIGLEFFGSFNTFNLVLITWMADHFDSGVCQSRIGKKYWSRFFFLYVYAFYIYNRRFNGQFQDLALFTCYFFILHSMIYFYHHYELPNFVRQDQIQLFREQNSNVRRLQQYRIILRRRGNFSFPVLIQNQLRNEQIYINPFR
ncbi:hypothetical protein QYM36_001415 [Artemia franciscana]|uniref:Membralin n=3 Tax=Artemia franciscana TaxID=6661 RepID=A0AA88IBE9_ARTSF|nr:hypothetical protein QYM36_001415 [Artemia franciscana]